IYHSLTNEVRLNQIHAAEFISPLGKSFIIDRKISELVVLDRPKLDLKLAEQAQNLGAIFRYQSSVRGISRQSNRKNWLISGRSAKFKEFKAIGNVIVSTEGHHPRITPQAGLSSPPNNWFFPAFQIELDNVLNIDRDVVELYFGKKFAPGFFVWLIPLNESRARLGLAIHPYLAKGVRKRLTYVIKKHPIISKKLKKSKPVNSWGGFVPACGPIPRTFTNGFMVAGDAAGQTKATTGGGFNIGGYCGYLAGKVAAESVFFDKYTSAFLKKYQQLWRSMFEPELSIMKLFRRCLSFLPDRTIENIFEIAIQTDIEVYTQMIQDIDLHGIGLVKYSLNPRVFTKAFRQIPRAAVSLFYGLTL
ncbi:MAG: NAD(P)/FAD-dependent oxidoreductase, partial [Candidatus Hodarchaeales archaeon]